MRKFFALALAVAMVLSLASVSFAADVAETEIVLSPFFKYDGDKDILKTTAKEYGKAYYALILEETSEFTGDDIENPEIDDTITTGLTALTDYDSVEKLKVKAEFEMGEDLVESVSIVKKCFQSSTGDEVVGDIVFADAKVVSTFTEDGNDNGTPADDSDDFDDWVDAAAQDLTVNLAKDYYYFVEIKTKAETVTGDADIIGTLEFNRKAKDDIAKVDDCKVDFAFNLFYENAYIDANGDSTQYKVEDEVTLKWDDLYVLKFESDEEVTLNFGSDPNEGEFTVDVSGQGKLLVNFNTKANEAIWAANEGVEMFFVNFNGAKFNRTGTFEYEMEDMVAAYQIVDDKLVEIAGLELDGDTATFSTRTLGNYVFAAAELVNPTVAVEAPVVEAPAVTNPSTGF